jgi:diguanylate cyclase (GGDEF)-like protein
MNKVLLIEDSRTFAHFFIENIENLIKFDIEWADSYRSAKEILEERSSEFFIGIVDIHLPDAEEGKAIDLVESKNLPVVVITSDYSEKLSKMCWDKMVVDYVIKEGIHNIDYLASLINRIYKNKEISILVADDSLTIRQYITQLLEIHQYSVIESDSGRDALQKLKEHPHVKLLITDYIMPEMNGLELVKEIRKKHLPDELSIIGISSNRDKHLSARFIKKGANDFIKKPFTNEEFYCRVTQNIDMLERVKEIRERANRDFLTGLYNRRFFFNRGKALHQDAVEKNADIAVVMIDIDHFKQINDSFGHEAGDEVLKKIAETLKESFGEMDLISRFGGEEFCILMGNRNKSRIYQHLEKLRSNIEQQVISSGTETVNVTVSIGASTEADRLESMIKKADDMLYKAKRGGRNRVVMD